MLPHRRRVAAPVEGFVAYGIGRSIGEDTIAAHRRGELNNASTVTVISQEYLRYADRYRSQRPLVAWVASTDHGSDRIGTGRRAGTMRRPGWSTRSGRRHAPGRCGVRALPRVAPRGQAQAGRAELEGQREAAGQHRMGRRHLLALADRERGAADRGTQDHHPPAPPSRWGISSAGSSVVTTAASKPTVR